MKMKRSLHVVMITAMLSLGAVNARAHCDGLDGPVVTAARAAFESGDVNRVLIWVRAEDEAAIRTAFEESMAVRKLGGEARSLADRYFFETLVRIHRQGEGAPYTGLKPAGRALGAAIPAADIAVETGSIGALENLLGEAMRAGLHERFEALTAKQGFKPNDIAVGRDYVESYVMFIHYAEQLYEAAVNAPNGHYLETED